MFVHYYLCAMARSSEGAAGVKSRPLVVGNSLEDIFGSHKTVHLTKAEAEGDGWMGLRRRRRRRKATSALMNACQHELPLDVAIIIRKKVGRHSHCTSFHFT